MSRCLSTQHAYIQRWRSGYYDKGSRNYGLYAAWSSQRYTAWSSPRYTAKAVDVLRQARSTYAAQYFWLTKQKR